MELNNRRTMAITLTNIIRSALGRFTHLIFGFLALPMGMLVGTDAYFFGLMPPIIEVGKAFGVEGICSVNGIDVYTETILTSIS